MYPHKHNQAISVLELQVFKNTERNRLEKITFSKKKRITWVGTEVLMVKIMNTTGISTGSDKDTVGINKRTSIYSRVCSVFIQGWRHK